MTKTRLERSTTAIALLAGLIAAAGCAATSEPAPSGEETAVVRAQSAPEPAPEFSADRLRAHMAWLADDARMGREAGSQGYQDAADYVAMQFRSAGVAPGGSVLSGEARSYFQQVPLRITQHVESEASFTRRGETVSGESTMIVSPSARDTEVSITAPVVFAGYGLVDPNTGRDDYAGLDVAGKIVVMLYGVPAGYQTEEQAHYSSTATKAVQADQRGAIGTVVLYTPEFAQRFGFERARFALLRSKRMSWIGPDGEPNTGAPGIQASGLMSMEGAHALFEGAEATYDEILAAHDANEELPRFALADTTMTLKVVSEHETLTSPNVIGLVKGTDPVLKDEYIVLSAHLDHIGADGPAVDGDVINNGAMDNASGTAALIEVAKAAAAQGGFKRSVLFAAVTAEEKGLVGADYLVQHPTFDGPMAANVNLDMPILTYDFTDVVAFGAERSNLEGYVREAAESRGMSLSPDPVPEQGLFTRSDHYSFVRGGIPSVYLVPGYANGGEEAWNAFLGERYHRATDDMGDHINFEAAERFADVNFAIMQSLANAPEPLVWKEGDFFGELFGGPIMAGE